MTTSQSELAAAFSGAALHIERLVGEQCLVGQGMSGEDLLDAQRVAAVMDGLRGVIEAEMAGELVIGDADREKIMSTFKRIMQIGTPELHS